MTKSKDSFRLRRQRKKINQKFPSFSVAMEWVLHQNVTTTVMEKKWVSWQQVLVFTLWRQWKAKKILFNLCVAVAVWTRLKYENIHFFHKHVKYIFTTTFFQSTVLALSTQRGLCILEQDSVEVCDFPSLSYHLKVNKQPAKHVWRFGFSTYRS